MDLHRLDLEENNSFMSLCQRMLQHMSMIQIWHWHTLTMKSGQPASRKYFSQRHVLHYFTWSYIVLHCLLFLLCLSFCSSKKNPSEETNFPRRKGSDCYFSQKPSTNRTIGVTPFPSLGATGAHRRGMTQDVVGLAGFQLDSALCTVWSTAE